MDAPTTNYLRNSDEFNGSHRFLAEELLQPMSCRTDLARINMFASHLTQTVVLNEPERPRVSSRFENKCGSYTTALRRARQAARVIGTFDRGPLQRVVALQYEDGLVDVFFGAPVRHLTENYGYVLDNSPTASLAVGDEIEKNQTLQGWPCHDEDMNFMYGVNLKTVFMNLEGMTYEDGLVISESAAERLAHTRVEQITVVVNSNDLCLNLYGEEGGRYQGFPEVGQQIRNDILMARRRINHDSILYELAGPQLVRINWESDTVFFCEGTVMDVEIFSNLSEAELDKHPFNRQLLEHAQLWARFRDWYMNTFAPYVLDEDGHYTENVAHWYRLCRDTGGSKWRHERQEFDGVVLRFTVAKSSPVVVGSKLTNRYGGKGVVSQIRPDHEMPTTVSGKRADIVVNSLGVVNRLNPGQLFESELNFIADHVAEQMASMDDAGAYAHMIRFLGIVSPDQARWIEETLNDAEKHGVAREVREGREHIYIHQPPVFGVVPLEGLYEAYKAFGVEREAFVGIEERMVLGTNYYIKLRHEPSGKLSARSAKHLSVSGVPAKNSKGVRTGTEHHSSTPIRLGEQEIQGLMAADQPGELARFLRLYATDEVSREAMISEMVRRPDPFSRERLVPAGTGITRPVAGLSAFLESVGLTFDSPEGEARTDEQEQQETEVARTED